LILPEKKNSSAVNQWKPLVYGAAIFVVKRDMLIYGLRKDIGKRAEVLTDNQISAFYEIFQKHSFADVTAGVCKDLGRT